jgi:imidazolonepropionase-like amidohydrolase
MTLKKKLLSAGVATALAGALVILAGVQSEPSLAQTSAVTALTGARVIDGTGRAPMEQATIVINNGRIESVGAASAVKVPPGATRIDMAGRTILPGFINAHAHVNHEPATKMTVPDDLRQRLRMYADYGITTAVSLGSQPADDQEVRRLRDEQNKVGLDRARVYTSGPSMRNASTAAEARAFVDRNADNKVDIIKFHMLNTAKETVTPEAYTAAIDQAHKRGLRVVAHIYDLKDAKGTVAAGLDVIGHSVRDQDVDAAFIAEMKKRDVGYIPTLTRDLSVFVYETAPSFFKDPFFLRGIALYRREMDMMLDPGLQAKTRASELAKTIKVAIKQAERNLKILSDAGVTIGMGSDTGSFNNPGRWQGYFEHTEMEMMASAGMSPMQVIVSATGGAARIMRLEKELGTIAPGKWADLVVLTANPLTDIRNTQKIDSVWIAGRRLNRAP